MMWVLTSFSRHFKMTGVRATGQKSFRHWMVVFCGMGMMVEDFRQDGTVVCVKDRLNILIKTPVSWSAQSFSTLKSGPAFFLEFTVLSTRLKPSSPTVKMWLVDVK